MTTLNKTEKRSEDDSREKQDGQERPAQEAPPQNPAESRRKRRIVLVVLIVVVIVGSIAALIWWLNARHFEATDDAFIDGHIVAISPKVSAIVSRVISMTIPS